MDPASAAVDALGKGYESLFVWVIVSLALALAAVGVYVYKQKSGESETLRAKVEELWSAQNSGLRERCEACESELKGMRERLREMEQRLAKIEDERDALKDELLVVRARAAGGL